MLDPDEGLKRFVDHVKELADAQAREIGLTVHVDENILAQVFARACISAEYHQIPVPEMSHYKELAHLAYWTGSLKPISIVPPMSPENIRQWVTDALGRALFGPGAIPKAASDAFDRASEAYQRYSVYPISETVAVHFITHFAAVEAQQKMRKIKRAADREAAAARHQAFSEILYPDADENSERVSVIENMVNMLRFHTLAPRAFAIFVEAVFAFEGVA